MSSAEPPIRESPAAGEAPKSASSTTVVGIGASAGGLPALREFFAAVPEESGLAFVVVVHLSREHESHLAEILQRHAPIPFEQVTRTTPLLPDRVYVIPPGCNLSAIDTHLRLSDLEEQRRDRAPVDHFFRTLAQIHGGHSVGVILSGAGSDGAQGVRHVRERGGLVIAQSPREAEYDGMPRSAIATGAVDLVLPLAAMPRHIVEFARTQPRVAVPEEEPEPGGDDRHPLQQLLALLQARTGYDFSRHRRSAVARRVRRRMQIRRVEQLDAYLELLRENGREAEALAEDFLIHATRFFGEPEIFRTLEEEVVPQLFERGDPGDRLRVWSVGCATGEEAYSLAMLLVEEAERRESPLDLQLFASDLHEHSLKHAREAIYPETIAADVSPERLERFFQEERGGYRIREELRRRVIFASHDLLRDPPFSRLDLVACRHLLQELQPRVREEVVELFHYALREEGFLLLGADETLDAPDLFRAESREHPLYRRSAAPGEPRLPRLALARQEAAPRAQPAGYGALHQRLVARQAPPSLLVNQRHEILHLSERAGRYLQHAGGVPSSDLLSLVREDLRIELRAALHAARESGRPTHSPPLPVTIAGETRQVVVRVSPAAEPELEGFVLVTFEEVESAPGAGEAEPERESGSAGELAAELEATRGRLHAIIEEYQTSQEEMRASNEELQSANEELRSALEELTVFQEEVQSANEELQTLNEENRAKVAQLREVSSDLQNLLRSAEIATLFLDRNLSIQRFTPQVSRLFNVRQTDRGRPLSDFTHRLGYDTLRGDAEQVLRTLVPVEREVADERGRWYLVRLLPYRTTQDRIEGVVITFVEITRRKRAEEALRELNETLERRVEERTREVRDQEERFRTLVETGALMVWTTDASGQVVEDSPSWRALTGQSLEEWVGSGWMNTLHPDDRAAALEDWSRSVETLVPLDAEYRIWHAPSGSWRWTNARAVPLRGEEGEVRGWIGMNIDIEERKRAEAARREVLRQLVTAEENERQRIARELHDQMAQLMTALLLRLKTLELQIEDAAHRARLQEVEELAGRIGREMQHLALELRPPALSNLGLELALRSHLEEWSARHEIEADFHSNGLGGERLPAEVETTLYRIVQEGLTNVLKHAGATRVSLLLEQRDGWVRVILEDDGRGFEVEETLASPEKAKRLGLRGMRERVALLGGELQIESSPGGGTTIFARIPAEEAQP